MFAYSQVSLQHTAQVMTVTAQRQDTAQAALFNAALSFSSSATPALGTAAVSRAAIKVTNSETSQPPAARLQVKCELSDLVAQLKDELSLQLLCKGLGNRVTCQRIPDTLSNLPVFGLMQTLLQPVRLTGSAQLEVAEQREFMALTLLLKLGEELKLSKVISSQSLTGLQANLTLLSAEQSTNYIIPLYYLTFVRLLGLRQLREKKKSYKEQKKERQKQQQQERDDLMQQFNECFLG